MSSKLMFFIIGSLSFMSSQAQFFPDAGNKQIVLGMNGNSAFIQIRKFTSETMSNRFGVTLNYNGTYNNSENNGLNTIQKNSFFAAGLSFGRQLNFKVGEKLSPYVALDANVGLSYSINSNDNKLTDSSKYNSQRGSYSRTISLISTNEAKSTYLNLGLSPVVGFNYYLDKNFALGAECSFNVVNFNYGLNIESKSHRESSYLQVINNYDPITGANTSNSYINITEPLSDNKNKAKTVYNFGGSINPSIKIVALFYFK